MRRLANVFVFDVHDAVRQLQGSTRAQKLIVETGLQYLDAVSESSRGDAQLEAELAAAYIHIGEVQGEAMAADLGDIGAAQASYEKARKLLDSALAHNPKNYRARQRASSCIRKLEITITPSAIQKTLLPRLRAPAN